MLVLPEAAEKTLATAKDADTVAKLTRHYASVIEGLDGLVRTCELILEARLSLGSTKMCPSCRGLNFT